MIKLISCEFKKIFSKKAIYILLIVALAFSVLTNMLYKFISGINLGNDYTDNLQRNVYDEELKDLNPNNPDDLSMYVNDKTEIYILDYCEDNDSWRCDYVYSNYYNDIQNYYLSIYDKNYLGDKELTKTKLEEKIDYLNKYSFTDMMKNKIADEEKSLADLKMIEVSSKREKNALDSQIKDLESEILKDKLILEHNAEEPDGYMRMAIVQYTESLNTIAKLDNGTELTKDQEMELKEAKANRELDKYIIDNEYDDSEASLLNNLRNFTLDYVFIIIITLIIISSSIMANEYHKGTIKQLLIKPYNRTQIFFSKLFTLLLFIPIVVIVLYILQFIVGGLFFGFNSLNDPILIYNYTKETLMEYNIWNYTIISIASKLPIFILTVMLSYLLSVVAGSTAVATTIPLFVYWLGSLFNLIINQYSVKWLKWFITNIWDLEKYLFGTSVTEPLCSFNYCVVIIVINILIFVILPLLWFKKKDIKNV